MRTSTARTKIAAPVTRAARVAEVVARAAGTHRTECATDAFDAAVNNTLAYMPDAPADSEDVQAAGVEDAIDALNSGACICHKV